MNKVLILALAVLNFNLTFGQNQTSVSLAHPDDPFLPYLTGKPPVIEEDLGIETRADGIKIHRFVFRSRVIETPGGPEPSLVFAAIAHPATTGEHPAILRLHGGGGSADIPSAVSSAKLGYVCLVLDIPGVAGGAVKSPKSVGPWDKEPKITAKPDATHSGLFDAVLASIQAVYLLKAEADVDASKIGVAGASWGGYTSTMVACILNKDLAAGWSVFGSGGFMEGANEKSNIDKLPEGERALFLKYLDPGSRAGNITKPFFIATASNDRHWSWMAVQATLASMKGPVNQLYSPNTNHIITYAGGSEMIPFFNQYLKGGPPMPKISIIKSRKLDNGDLEVQYSVAHAVKPVNPRLYYTNPDDQPIWTERIWKAVEATPNSKGYTAIIPASAAKETTDMFAIITDIHPELGQDSTSVSSLIQRIK
ncbi:MAG TPA: acetylxylan esterase [Mucilaginibacter sp.]|jgi:dienelactone hydrolase|nr:acetylxylan esterase [Mucilaginibacter sp.]